MLALILGMAKTLLELRFIVFGSLDDGFRHIVASVLTIFIVIDLFKTFVDFHEHDRIKLTNVTDATILIIMREVALGLYSKEFEYQFIISLAILLMVLGIIRVMAIKYSPNETQKGAACETQKYSVGETRKYTSGETQKYSVGETQKSPLARTGE